MPPERLGSGSQVLTVLRPIGLAHSIGTPFKGVLATVRYFLVYLRTEVRARDDGDLRDHVVLREHEPGHRVPRLVVPRGGRVPSTP